VSVNGAKCLRAAVSSGVHAQSVCGRTGTAARRRAHLARPAAEYFLIFRDPVSPEDLADYLYPEYAASSPSCGAAPARWAWSGGFIPCGVDGAAPGEGAVRPATKLRASGWLGTRYLLFGRPEFRLGSLLEDPLERLLGDQRLEFFGTFRGNTCPRVACGYRAICRGGCPAVSLLVSGDLAAPDPRCAVDQKAGVDSGVSRSGSKRMPARS
jgi:radical SAM protein with 4Fe4S-binding SPASM domain